MTNIKSKSQFDAKLKRLEKLTAFIAKVDEAILGEEPQMRKEYQKLKKIAIKEMSVLNVELKNLAEEIKTEEMV